MKFAICGSGLITSVGRGVEQNFGRMCEGVTGRRPLQYFDSEKFNAQYAYEIAATDTGNPHTFRATHLLCQAIDEAVRQAGLKASELTDIPIIVGTGLRELRALEQWHVDHEALQVDQLHFGSAIRNKLQAWSPSYTVSNACSASLFALGLAEDMLALDQADTVIVAGCDVLTASMFGLLDRVQITPPQQVQPFDANRKGVLMGEGGAAVILSRKVTPARPIQGWLRGVGLNCDAYHETAPQRQGIVSAVRLSHERAQVHSDDIDVVFMHGTGTLLNDRVEAEALSEVFPASQKNVAVTAIKSMTGHTSGASGLASLIIGLQTLTHQRIPPTVGVEHVIPELGAPFQLIKQLTPAKLRLGQINAFGFGGVNAVAIIEHA